MKVEKNEMKPINLKKSTWKNFLKQNNRFNLILFSNMFFIYMYFVPNHSRVNLGCVLDGNGKLGTFFFIIKHSLPWNKMIPKLYLPPFKTHDTGLITKLLLLILESKLF